MSLPEFTEAEFDRLYAEAAAVAGPIPSAPSAPSRSQPSREPRRVNPVDDEPSRSSSTRSTLVLLGPPVLLGSRALLGPEDLTGERFRALDADPRVREALDRIGVRDTRDYAAKVSGRDRKRNPVTFALWKLDMLRAAGLVVPVPVELRELPESASDAARLLRDRFGVALGLRWLRPDGIGGMPYSRRFAAEWCALPETTAMRGIGELLEARIIVKVGTAPTRSGLSEMALYAPAPEVES